jgi:hypothetical protein
MVRLREMLLVIAALATPIAWGQEGGSIAHAQKNFDAESLAAKPNKLPEVHGLTLAGRQANPVRDLKENPPTELFKGAEVSALQEQTSRSGRLSGFLKSNPGSVPAGTAPNAIQMKDLLDLGPIGRDARLLDSVRNSNSRWKMLLPSDLDKK